MALQTKITLFVREHTSLRYQTRLRSNIEVFEMAADTTGSYLGVLAGAVFNEFVNTTTAAQNITNAGLGINVWNVREARMSPGFSGDALTNTINVTVVGAMVI